ncbi:mfs general substrate transporter [Ceraceosorus bombacis]|uniref:Mfs general substrate transporter n=1 Tax=Ceraceosorus bombacis TaxID=401625 RepID=A0A0P1BA47_9BASI|nr:mfs general substrate transporter [Ceraceosorus bombacis]
MSQQEPRAPVAEIEANAPSYDYNEASKQHHHHHHHHHHTPSKSAGSHSDDDGSVHSRDARGEIVAEEGAQGVAPGIDLLGDIIISDLTPLQWRQFFTSGLTSPYFITAYIGGFIVDGLGITDADYGHDRQPNSA